MVDHRKAVASQLRRWGRPLSGTALASLALGLAERLDDEDTPATAYASIAKELHAVLDDLQKAAPTVAAKDSIQTRRDELKARRDKQAGEQSA